LNSEKGVLEGTLFSFGRYAIGMRVVPLFLCLLFISGCRGPSNQQIAGTGLTGALLYAGLSWAALCGIARVTDRIRHRKWMSVDWQAGLWPLLISHGALSILVFVAGEHVRASSTLHPLIWGCAAANHLAWGIVFWRLGQIPPAWAALIAGVPSLLLGLGGALGSKALATAVMVQWFWGGFLGVAPGVLTLLVWGEARLRRPPALPPD
jgi:hypothetical protein